MADNLEISCPECDKMMTLPAEMAGKKVRCKACGHVFRVEASGSSGKAKAKAVKAKADPKPSAKAKASPKGKPTAKAKAKGGAVDEVDANPYGLTEEYLGPRCPFCAQAMEEEDIICLECGYNTQTRTRQETRRVAERNFNDWFLWLFPAIMGIFIVLTLVAFDIWFIMWVPKPDEESWFSFDGFRKGVKLWFTIGTLFIMFFCVVFAFKRLVLNPIPPERKKPMEFATVVKIMAALAVGSLLMLTAVAIPAILIAGLGVIPLGIGFWAGMITLFSAGWGTVTTALQYNNVGTYSK